MAMAKTASNQLCICLRIIHVQWMPKVSIFMAGTTKRVTEKTQFFWPKLRYNGRDMAREVFFIICKCLLVSCVPSLVAPGFLGRPVHTTLS